MWSVSGKGKEDAVVKFCGYIAAFANAKGGVLIVGISNERPRKVVGIEDLENRLKYTKDVILGQMKFDSDFTYFKTVSMKDGSREKVCLVIAVAETKNVVSIIGQSLCPIRVQTGISWRACEEIRNSKVHVSKSRTTTS